MSEKQATHTPGPWENASVGIGSSATQVVWLGENTDKRIQVIGTGKDQANARLIARAPEMHEVLSELLDTLELSKDYGFDDEYEKVRAVLAKVEGESA